MSGRNACSLSVSARERGVVGVYEFQGRRIIVQTWAQFTM